MAVTSYGLNDELAVKLWSKTLSHEIAKNIDIAPLIGEGSDAIIQLKTETQKQAGDKVTFGLRMQLSGAGVTEGQTLEGNEESLTTYSDSVYINELAHAVRMKADGTIDVQRVPFNLRSEAKDGLRDWYTTRMSETFFRHVCGYSVSPTADAVYRGHNTVTAPTSGRQIWAGSATTDQGLGSADTFSLELIDYAKEMAETATPKIRPGKGGKYVMYLHPYQITDLRTNTSTGQWLDIQKAAMMGGQVSNNPIYSGAIGEYNNVVLRRADQVTQGVNSSTSAAITTVRRAVFLGAQSAVMAFGQDRSISSYKWVEEMYDYQRQFGVAVKTIFGLKKTVFNSTDFGAIVVSTYAAAHT